jgi:hypothetical protein
MVSRMLPFAGEDDLPMETKLSAAFNLLGRNIKVQYTRGLKTSVDEKGQ